MKTLVASFITALLVFTLATVWIDMVGPRLAAFAAASSPHALAANGARRHSSRSDDEPAMDDDESARGDSLSSRSRKKAREELKKAEEQQARLQAQLDQVKLAEARLLERQQTMKMLYEDIFRVLAEEESQRRRSESELAQVERQLAENRSGKSGMAAEAGDSAAASGTASRKAASDTKIADLVQNLANRGSGSAAAMLLSGLKEREAAKVLGILNARNPRLATRLSNQVQAARQDTNPQL